MYRPSESCFGAMMRRPPRSTLFPYRRSSDLRALRYAPQRKRLTHLDVHDDWDGYTRLRGQRGCRGYADLRKRVGYLPPLVVYQGRVQPLRLPKSVKEESVLLCDDGSDDLRPVHPGRIGGRGRRDHDPEKAASPRLHTPGRVDRENRRVERSERRRRCEAI